MKYVLVFPPLVMGFAPIIGVPQLQCALKSNDVDTIAFDCNIDFLDYVLSKNYFDNLLKYADKIKKTDKNVLSNLNLSIELIEKNYSPKDIEEISQKIEFAKRILKDKKLFYRGILCDWAMKIIKKAGNIIFRILAESEGAIYAIKDISVDSILNFITLDINIYRDYAKKFADVIIKENPDCVGLSINSIYQIIFSFTLAYYIKQKSNIHINFGGMFVTENYKIMKEIDKIIGTFADSISIGDSEKSICELIKAVSSHSSLESVHNLIYKTENNEIKINNFDFFVAEQKQPFPSFDGYKFEQYFLPEIILPIYASKSCYWGKCEFCNCKLGKKIDFKSPERFVDEIEYLSKKYKTKFFYFWDNSIHPKYFSKLADLLIQRKLNIKYMAFARFEKEFTQSLLEKLYKSGLVKINWGLDSGCDRVLKYINKGSTVKQSEEILKLANKAKVRSWVHVILGFPTETKFEVEQSVNFFKKNKKYITYPQVSTFMAFLFGAKMFDNKEELSKQIYTTMEERIILEKRIYDNFRISKTQSKRTIPWYEWGQVALLYYSRYSHIQLKTLEFILNFMLANKTIHNLYIKNSFRKYVK